MDLATVCCLKLILHPERRCITCFGPSLLRSTWQLSMSAHQYSNHSGIGSCNIQEVKTGETRFRASEKEKKTTDTLVSETAMARVLLALTVGCFGMLGFNDPMIPQRPIPRRHDMLLSICIGVVRCIGKDLISMQ